MERSLIGRMGAESTIHAIVETMAKLGSSLSIDVVAKGVETTAQMRAVKRAGCTMARGAYFGKLLGSRAAATLLASRQRTARKSVAHRRKAPTGA
jgi:EAL domain-containing protein (putative c-di-GMP-specific phosphodiesterase class I)